MASVTPSGRSPEAGTERMEWMDLLRGTAIVLVILFHAIGTPWWLFEIDVPEWMYVLADAFGPFRMPMLVMMSGMLVSRALTKPPGRYLSGKARTLLWPFAVWAVFEIFTVDWLTDGGASSILDPAEWLDGYTHLWFLPYLASYYVIALVLRALPAWLVALAMWQLSIIAPGYLSHFLYLGGFFFAGKAIFAHLDSVRRWLTPPMALLLAGTGIALGVMATRGADVLNQAEWVPMSLAGILALIALALRLPPGAARWLRAIGRDSIVYYLPHLPVGIAVVRLLVENGVPVPPWALVAAATASSLLVGGVLATLRHNPLVGWLFEWPWGAGRSRTDQPSMRMTRPRNSIP